jgi:Sodium/hydrogen exchanger family
MVGGRERARESKVGVVFNQPPFSFTQVALTLALGYLSFYTANIFHLSGVVSVAVFGLYGAATSTWDMPPAAHPAFEAFWDSLSFTANAIVFFFTGVAVVNFLQRAAQRMNDADAAAGVAEGGAHRLWVGLWRFPIVYVLVFGLRFALLTAFRPLFRLEGSDLPLKDAVFATVAGLRGSVALILAQAVMTGDVGTELPPSEIRVSLVGKERWKRGRWKPGKTTNSQPTPPLFLRSAPKSCCGPPCLCCAPSSSTRPSYPACCGGRAWTPSLPRAARSAAKP